MQPILVSYALLSGNILLQTMGTWSPGFVEMFQCKHQVHTTSLFNDLTSGHVELLPYVA